MCSPLVKVKVAVVCAIVISVCKIPSTNTSILSKPEKVAVIGSETVQAKFTEAVVNVWPAVGLVIVTSGATVSFTKVISFPTANTVTCVSVETT